MTLTERILRDAAADAAAEVLWHLERGSEPPPHMLAEAERLLAAIGDLDDPIPPTGAAGDHPNPNPGAIR